MIHMYVKEANNFLFRTSPRKEGKSWGLVAPLVISNVRILYGLFLSGASFLATFFEKLYFNNSSLLLCPSGCGDPEITLSAQLSLDNRCFSQSRMHGFVLCEDMPMYTPRVPCAPPLPYYIPKAFPDQKCFVSCYIFTICKYSWLSSDKKFIL